MTGDRDEAPDLGPCCACGASGNVRTIMMLGVRAPEPGKGWGCVVCGLPPDGAYAVLCDLCAEFGVEPREAVAGYPGEGRRVPIEACTGPHEHRLALHPELAGPAS